MFVSRSDRVQGCVAERLLEPLVFSPHSVAAVIEQRQEQLRVG